MDAVFAMVINGAARTQEDVLGCAVLALEHVGVKRPRIGTVRRVAGVMAEMMSRRRVDEQQVGAASTLAHQFGRPGLCPTSTSC